MPHSFHLDLQLCSCHASFLRIGFPVFKYIEKHVRQVSRRAPKNMLSHLLNYSSHCCCGWRTLCVYWLFSSAFNCHQPKPYSEVTLYMCAVGGECTTHVHFSNTSIDQFRYSNVVMYRLCDSLPSEYFVACYSRQIAKQPQRKGKGWGFRRAKDKDNRHSVGDLLHRQSFTGMFEVKQTWHACCVRSLISRVWEDYSAEMYFNADNVQCGFVHRYDNSDIQMYLHTDNLNVHFNLTIPPFQSILSPNFKA